MIEEGWWFPANSRKAHYMVGTRSLCGRWSTFGKPTPGMYEQGHDELQVNCAECRRRLAKSKAAKLDAAEDTKERNKP